MKLTRALITAAALCLAATVHAHDCSGGADGGMDATGNQCNDRVAIAMSAEQWRTAGLAAYERGHYAEALAAFRRAAESGDVRSAEMLALMYRHGPRLYPAGVPANPGEAARWAAIAATAGRREAAAVAAR